MDNGWFFSKQEERTWALAKIGLDTLQKGFPAQFTLDYSVLFKKKKM